MKRSRSLRFEALEARQLLSQGHVAVAHAAAVLAGPIVLTGTLSVDNNPQAITSTTNPDGSTTTSVPVTGNLGTLGRFRGVWDESTDAYGNYQGPDTIQLHNAQGAIVVAFNDQYFLHAPIRVKGGISYLHNQKVLGGTKAYAGATETGTITVTTNRTGSDIMSIALASVDA